VPITIGGREMRPGESTGEARRRLGLGRNYKAGGGETPPNPRAYQGGEKSPQYRAAYEAWLNRKNGSGGGGSDGSSGRGRDTATFTGYLRAMGLDELERFVDNWTRQGLTWPEIQMLLEDPKTEPGQVVDRIYPELREYRTNNPGFPPISIGAIQEYRQDLSQMVQQRGLAEAFGNVNDVARKWMTAPNGGKSLVEMGERLDLLQGEVAAIATSPAVQAELEAWERFYGVRPSLSDLTALVINPDESAPRLQQKFASVRFDVAAGREGFGDLSVGEAERLANAGIDPNRSQETFGALVRNRELFGALDRGEDTIDRDTQMDAAFGLSNAEAARRRIDDRARRRAARFQGGGQVASGRFGGLAGLSTAS